MNAQFVVSGAGSSRPSSRNQTIERCVAGLAILFAVGTLEAQVQVAGTLYVDLRATHASAGSATWTNQASLGHFTEVGAPALDTNVAGTAVPGVLFTGSPDAYQGPSSVADLHGGSDRTVEIWAYNPSLAAEETTVSWGHRGTDGRNLGFNFGNNAVWGAVTHYGGAYDVGWGATPPTAAAWHHLVYTYSNVVTRIYVDGGLANSRTLGAALNTFANEPINLGCQRNTSNGVRSFFYSGYLNTVRIHGGVLSANQVLTNYLLGAAGAPTIPPPIPTALAASPGYTVVYLQWNVAAGAARYHLKRATASGEPYSLISSNLTGTTYLDIGLSAGTNYFYTVAAQNSYGTTADSSPVSAMPALPTQPVQAGTLHVDLRATNASAGSSTWLNQGTLGNFSIIGTPALSNNVEPTAIPGVFFNGSTDAYLGPNSVADLEGGSDRSIEVWAYNPSLVEEETTVSWGHRGTTRRNMGFNFGNNGLWGAATHWNDDVSWGGTPPPEQAWQHLVYTYENSVVRVYVDGALRNIKGLGGALNTFAGDPINLGCQREASSALSLFYGGYLNTVRIHGGVLNPAQVEANYYFGPHAPPPQAVDDFVTLNPGKMALVPVLANDTVGSLFNPGVVLASSPSSGTAQVKPGGKILYTHNGGPATTDQFSYSIQTLSATNSQVATVHVTISPALRLPNTTLNVPDTPPLVGYQIVDAFPGLFFEDAVAITTPRGRTNQIFVAERRGRVSYVPDINAASPTRQVLMDIVNQVSFDDTIEGERGLLGLAFHPGFQTNGYFYVCYTAPGSPYFDRLSRFTADPNTLAVNTNSQLILFEVVDQVFNHNGSDLHFGPDGYLYIGMGDEGDQYNARLNSQRIDKDLFSALLRIDVDKRPGSIEPRPSANTTTVYTNGLGQAYYSIPPDNPFVNATTFLGSPINTSTLRAEIFAVGFRHIWRFSIDTNGDIWVGDVGQDRFEEINIVTNGGNYGWAYLEGYSNAISLYPNEPTLLSNPPPQFVPAPPLYVYPHTGGGGDPQYSGNSVSGGVVYRGTRLPDITGAYVFGDFESGHVWALRRTNATVTVQRIAGVLGAAAFAIDPGNGDVLIANYAFNQVQRLVLADVSNSTYPTKLSDTGVFADVETLAPNPGVVNYEPIVAFWSDYAIKRRWFTIPDTNSTVTAVTDGNWTYPNGMKWIKHFDLELERGNPATKKRIETRILVRNATGAYGVSYAWNDAGTEAYLVPDGGTNFYLLVQVGLNTITQQVEIPSRAACLACHTTAGGRALSFNTRELNQSANLNGFSGNQLALLGLAGYLNAPMRAPQTLPAFATAGDSAHSLEYRVRSYLAVNCVQCHQPGGAGASTWDARPWLTLYQTGLINGEPDNNGANPLNKLVVPGDTAHSVLLQRILGNGFTRMPPLATHQLDLGASNLLTAWISTELTNHQTFAQWQLAHFGSTNAPNAQAGADPDSDGANNYYEFLTRTLPLTNAPPPWTITIDEAAGTVGVSFLRLANLGFLVETAPDFVNWTSWDVPANQFYLSASDELTTIAGRMFPGETNRFFRVKIFEP